MSLWDDNYNHKELLYKGYQNPYNTRSRVWYGLYYKKKFHKNSVLILIYYQKTGENNEE